MEKNIVFQRQWIFFICPNFSKLHLLQNNFENSSKKSPKLKGQMKKFFCSFSAQVLKECFFSMRLIGFPKKNILVSSLVHTNTNNHLTFHQDICFYLDGFLQIKGYIVYIYIEQQDDVPGICRTFLGENLPCNISVKSDSSGQALSKHQKVPNGLMIYIRYRLLLPWLLGRQNATQIGQKNVLCT